MRPRKTDVGERLGKTSRRITRRSPASIPAGAVKAWQLGSIKAPSYTDATRPAASSVGAGYVIYNSTDSGLNVSDGTNWRMPGAAGGWDTT